MSLAAINLVLPGEKAQKNEGQTSWDVPRQPRMAKGEERQGSGSHDKAADFCSGCGGKSLEGFRQGRGNVRPYW